MSAIDPVKMARYAQLARLLRRINEEKEKEQKQNNGHPSDKAKIKEEEKEKGKATEPRDELRAAKRRYYRKVGAVSALR